MGKFRFVFWSRPFVFNNSSALFRKNAFAKASHVSFPGTAKLWARDLRMVTEENNPSPGFAVPSPL